MQISMNLNIKVIYEFIIHVFKMQYIYAYYKVTYIKC